MRKIIFLLVVVSLVFFSCKSNYTRIGDKNANYIPYYLKVYEADSLYLINDFKGSYKILDSLFKKYEPINMDDYYEYGVYLSVAYKTNQTKNLKNDVVKGFVKYGGIKTLHKDRRSIYNELINSIGINEKSIDSLKLLYYKSLDLKTRNKFLSMYERDREARLKESNNLNIEKVDDENGKIIDEILKEYEFPSKSIIGSNAAYDIPDGGILYLDVLFRHQDEKNRERYLPILYKAVKKGFLEPFSYAVVYDRDLILKNKEQYFGTYECPNDCNLSKNIDSIRTKIGLPHIKYNEWRLNQF